ncbi:heme-binding domain-containing protein [Flavivirga algicola]|uniref:Heme-binding domain-containing protein n=1 Tax=Flavivirga algicola TaxID=2729136 RepID=A0ABX1RT50_9FLAO|nr:heme-binding domain-containing protein [Flavivirga algicola]NMH86258.1 heme-binding domain-containing protein [Flavivirga algicola]
MRIIKKILIVLLIALILIQFFRPEKNDAAYREVVDFETETKVSKEVAAILKAQCYDCHSNKSEYPWYAEVAPVSFWINHHIEEGNEHFNVSKWDTYNDKKKDHKLDELIEEIEEGKMPLHSYTWMHDAMTQKEKEVLIAWAKKARENYNLE